MNPTHSRAAQRLTVLSSAALLLAACSGADAAGTNNTADSAALTAEAPDEVTPGGTLSFAVGSDAGCVDPQQVTSNDSIYSVRHLADSLTDQDPETGEIVPWLAESWEISDDASEFTFTLVEGATFSDGTPVNAEAVKVNFDDASDPGPRGTLARGYLAGYVGTEVVDDQTFTVTFEGPNAQFLQATSTHTLGILAPASVAQTDDERCTSVIGSGPFVLEDYTPNASINLTKREDYDWGSSLWEHEGAAYLDRVEFSVVPESGVRLGAVQSGEVDVIGNIASQDELALSGTGVQLLPRANPGLSFGLVVNHEDEALSDPALRAAVSRAINRQEIVDAVYTSFTLPATSILSSTTPLYADQAALLGHDPAQAEQTLQDAGYAKGDDGIYEKDGQRASFDILWFNNAATNAPTLELIQQQLAAVGIEVTLSEGQVADWGAKIAEGDFEANWSNQTRADADILRTAYSTELANSYRLPPSGLDQTLADQAAAADPEVRSSLVGEAQETILTDYHAIPVVELTTVLAAGPTVYGVAYDSGSRVQLFDAWIGQ